ncbi:hypothetical protein ACFPU0_23075 [Pseudomonas sp. GCM10022186]|uniref:hypothetical protein n=1 Tax=Pseudomonas sp. GCM10022186 TaxID=3252650 RepID=UPI003619F6A3
MALVLWLLAFGLAASHGCLSYPPHDPVFTHAEVLASTHDQSHQLHASGCLQFCEDGASTLNLSPGNVSFDLGSWVLLILPAFLLSAVIPPRFGARAIHLPAPPRPPARLSFVRFDD